MPDGLEEGLLKNLRIISFLKSKFEKRKNSLPKELLEQYNHKVLIKLANKRNADAFLSAMQLLGFSKTTKYIWLEDKEVNIKTQAKDYMNFLFEFDNTMHESLSSIYGTPIDNKSPGTSPKKDYKKIEKALNKYIHYLSE